VTDHDKPLFQAIFFRKIIDIVGGYGSHEKGVDGGERLAQQRDRNEVTNSRSESKKEQ
jgi:hypothetical protein